MKETFPPRPQFPAVSPEDVDAGQWMHHQRELQEWFEKLLAHSHVQSVMHIPEDEPIFVLRAQDKLAPSVVTYWILQADCGIGVPDEKIEGARLDRDNMLEWQAQNPEHVKIPD